MLSVRVSAFYDYDLYYKKDLSLERNSPLVEASCQRAGEKMTWSVVAAQQ